MKTRWQVALAGFLTGIGMAGAGLGAWRRRAPRRGHHGPDAFGRGPAGRGSLSRHAGLQAGAGDRRQGLQPELRPVPRPGCRLGRDRAGPAPARAGRRRWLLRQPGDERLDPQRRHLHAAVRGCPQPGGDLGDPLLARHRGRRNDPGSPRGAGGARGTGRPAAGAGADLRRHGQHCRRKPRSDSRQGPAQGRGLCRFRPVLGRWRTPGRRVSTWTSPGSSPTASASGSIWC